MAISIILPHLNEPANLEASVNALRPELQDVDEILVADQGSQPEVLERIRSWASVKVIEAPARRALALNAGAAAAAQEILMFVPPGVQVRRGWRAAAMKAASPPGFALGWFQPAYRGRHPALLLADGGAWLSSLVFKLPSLRQALTVKAADFPGGEVFRDLPDFEGWDLARRMKGKGKAVRIGCRAVASSAAFAARGPWAHLLDTARAWNLIRQGGEPAEGADLVADPRRALILLLTWPEAGKVKPGLARVIGEETAAEVSKALVTRTLEEMDLLRFSPTRYAAVRPAEKVEEARGWLGPSWTVSAPEATDPGERVAEAVAAAFEAGASKVVAAVADTLNFDGTVLKKAYDLLGHAAVAIGPTPENGLFLVGLAENRPEILKGIDWNASDAVERLSTAASKQGLHFEHLPPMRDVESAKEVEMMRYQGVLQAV